ncbi:MAG TPA: hypothetical protein PKV55_11330 [Nitrospira sp.]|nr:hypothetical protein [Nitrospira sp.]HNA27546.1 hypothetical protein [Nitrospira sp.]HNI68626.1 hypothetical protein [Nitrospira sp.]HNK13675.1 hypothetical protein [Nitrospira sp.]HNL88379.1 hypothetical protein [Nitrospira sp.]
MDDNQMDGASLIPERPELRVGEVAVDTAQIREGRTASMLPLVVLYQRAWDLAQAAEVSFGSLMHSAEAAALADAIRHLLDEVGDQEGSVRWSVRFSEARHLSAVLQDALAEGRDTEL